ncbi:TonB-dependent receptor [Pseudoxanthomonas winnipegensis]|uniref:TonB-dependent receptor n=1 Tax=Pseudoxanthomonas winnipegensis TaxID=2480810 RepID=A0A4Q8LC25_9GAMM|nr:TonB-dependent receptor [Pseudoxanthomonas winnipegensis]RZZ83178.1 TonB-dependent receptor [Pseudoxanthomonas winnipegensis]TAA26153.1 TonB-dependent receptor [Pseudoxanthomonas winnipegensis]TBV72597.1 TonB-dependent receptor [Pseudoxanthomonas winnipegensis]
MKHMVAMPRRRLLVSAMLVALSATAAAQTAPESNQAPASSAAQATPGNASAQSSTDATNLDAVQVKGIRQSMMSSANLKRDSQGVVDGIVAEDMGKFPDTNLAESLQRITGVSIDRSNGEGSKVTVRGVGPDFNLVLLNGRQMPTATGGRAFEFSDLASEAISAVEVYKTSRASTPAGGIGATINIKTSRPLENPGFHASAGVKGVVDTSDDDLPGHYEGKTVTPEISGIFSNTWADNRFGISLSASRQDRESGSALAQVAPGNGWQTYIDTPQANGVGGPNGALAASPNVTNRPGPNDVYSMPQSLGYSVNSVHRQRTNGQLAFQFAPTDNLTATLDYTYSENKIQSARNDMSVWFNFTPDQSSWTDGSGSSPLTYHETYGCTPRVYPGGASDPGCSDLAMGASKTAVVHENKSLGFNVDWRVTDSFSLNFDYHDSSAESRPDSPYGSSNTMSTAGFFRQGAGFDMSGDFPILMLNLPPGMSEIDPSMMQATGSVFRNDYQKAKIKQGQLSGQFQFEDYSKLNFGVSSTEYKNRSAFTNVQLDTWGGNVPAGPGAYDDSLFKLAHMGDYFDGGGANSPAFSDAFFLFDFEAMRQAAANARTNAGLGVPEDYLASTDYSGAAVPGSSASRTVGDSRVQEKSHSAYLEWSNTFDLSMPLSVAVGVRYEDTKVTASALQPAPVAVNWASANEFNLVYQGNEFYTLGGDYKYWLPNLDLALDLTSDMKLRFSAGKTIGRPNWGDLNAAQTLGSPARYDGGGGGSGNPALKPLVSRNLDLSWEWYYAEGSYVSVGYFYKKIDNFIARQTQRETPIPDLYTPAGGAYWNEAVAAGCAQTDRPCIRDYIFANHDGDPGVNAATGSIVGQPGDPVLAFNISKPVNNRSDKLDGWEFNIQHVFGETGFGVAANYTKVDSGLTYNNGVLGTQFALTGLSDTANFVVFYDKGPWQARAAYNWRDEFLSALGDGKGDNPLYVEAYGQLDLSFSYEINDHFSVSLEGINVTDESTRVHGRNKHQVYSLEQFGPRYMFGARYKF